MENRLPWRCPKHPNAKIKHSWDRTQFVYNDGYPRGGFDDNHKYECGDCRTELRNPSNQKN